jgi:hypothetical protein
VYGIFLGIIILVVMLLYMFNEPAREWMNIYLLRKSVTEDDIATIELEVDKTQSIYAYDRYISVLENGKLRIYNSYASKEADLDVPISNPMYAHSNDYMVVAEKGGQKVFLISGAKVLWEKQIEGNISKVNVSKTGYVSVIVTGTMHKSVIITFDKNGEELFKAFRAFSIAIDTDVSVDGKYLAVGEINTSGSLIQSSVNIIDVEKAVKGDGTDSTVFIHNADSNRMLTNIKYQEKGQLVCIYDDSIHMIDNEKDNVLVEFKKNTQIADINLKSYIVMTEEISTGPFTSKTDIILKNIITGAETKYSINSSIKEIVAYNNISAVNIGTEILLINLNGWVEKKYTSHQEAKEIVLGTSIAGIVYRDRIKVLSF